MNTGRKIMKHWQFLTLLGAMTLAQHAGAALFQSGTLNTAIPDNNLTGISSTIDISSAPFATVTDVNVRLNISGGYNGDLYVYLTHDGATAILLNRIGTTGAGGIQGTYGYSGAGMNAWIDDSALTGKHRREQVAVIDAHREIARAFE